MAIIRNESPENIGYFLDKKGKLTNFVFEILSVEYNDNLYGDFTLKITNDHVKYFVIEKLCISGTFLENFSDILEYKGNYICYPALDQRILLDIFSYEFEVFSLKFKTK
jgi:hypothetical protein